MNDTALPDDPVDLGNGYVAAWCVEPDGSSWPWLIVPNSADNAANLGCKCRGCAPHEQGGRPPRSFLEAAGCVCGQPRTNGELCKNLVAHPGDTCSLHTPDPPTRLFEVD